MATEQQDVQQTEQSEMINKKIAVIRLKADLEKVIFEYGSKEEITCLDTIKVLADLQKDMVDIIERDDDDEEVAST